MWFNGHVYSLHTYRCVYGYRDPDHVIFANEFGIVIKTGQIIMDIRMLLAFSQQPSSAELKILHIPPF